MLNTICLNKKVVCLTDSIEIEGKMFVVGFYLENHEYFFGVFWDDYPEFGIELLPAFSKPEIVEVMDKILENEYQHCNTIARKVAMAQYCKENEQG